MSARPRGGKKRRERFGSNAPAEPRAPKLDGVSLADRFLAQKWNPANQLVHESVQHHVNSLVRRARRIVFDETASRRVGEIGRSVPDLIAENQEFARAPYEVTWIEVDATALVGATAPPPEDIPADAKVGWLIEGNSVYTIPMDHRYDANLMPFLYKLGVDWSLESQLAVSAQLAHSRTNLDAFFWGGAITDIKDPDRNVRALRARNAVEVLPIADYMKKRSQEELRIGLNSLSMNAAGDLRNILTCLLVLNRPSLVRVVRDQPARRGFIGNKIRPFMSHTVVTIDLEPEPAIRHIGGGDFGGGNGAAKRRHEVRGHWCQSSNTARSCVHEWARIAGKKEQYRCQRCDGKRWWRHEHHRGDASLGFVQKTYAATV